MTANRHALSLMIVAVLLLLAAPLLWSVSPWMLRVTAILVWVLVTRTLVTSSRKMAIGSALFLLPSLILVFYSLAGAIEMEFRGGAIPIDDPSAFLAEYERMSHIVDMPVYRKMPYGFGNATELIVIEFALGLLAALAAITSGKHTPTVPTQPRPYAVPVLLGMAAAIAAISHLPQQIFGMSADLVGFVLLAMIAFAIAQASLWWAGGSHHGGLIFWITTGLAIIGFFDKGMKPLALLVPTCLILVLVVRRPNLRQTAFVLTGLTALTVVGILGMGLARGTLYFNDLGAGITQNIKAKIVYRQAETMFCLASAASKAALIESNPIDPGYFLGILIPRRLWPEKPEYSRGDSYAVEYCLFSRQGQTTHRHSASITLLGEAFLHGGKIMVFLVGIILIAGLTLVTLSGMRGPSALTAGSLAMTGWLADFDQLTALYLGNAVKVAIAMSPTVLIFHYLSRPGRRFIQKPHPSQ